MLQLANLIGPDLRAALDDDPEGLREVLVDMHPEELAEIIEDLGDMESVELIRLMGPDLAADVLQRLPPDRQVDVMESLEADEAAELLSEMDPDDRVDVVQELTDDHAELVLAALQRAEPEAAEEIRELVHYPPESAGGLMTTDVISLPPETKVWQAIERVREIAHAEDPETIYYIYVCAYGGKLMGVVSLREMILGDPGQTLAELMNSKVVRVEATDDQEVVADTIARYDLPAIPVVDEHERLLGLVTVDDVVDVVIEEATEDAQKMGGVVPLEDSYFATSFLEFVWKRGAVLVVLFMGQLLTATVMEANSALLAQTMTLVIFVPLILSSGGNTGSQSAALVIRAMAVGEIEPSEWYKVLVHEVAMGLCLGLILGSMGFVRGYIAHGEEEALHLGVAVGLSTLCVVSLGATLGSVLPLATRRIGLDPAVSSNPFIASLSDVLGLTIYFAVAGFVLHVVF